MREIIDVPLKQIASNPYRRLHAYPYIDSKIEALQRSIADVGVWPSVIARALTGDRLWKYELAFGHHRVEAARRSGLIKIPVIVESLNDKQMLQYMGRENLEDYNAAFLIQLESWEAVIKSGLCPPRGGQLPHAIDIATLLGWLELAHPERKKSVPQLNKTARACDAAYAMISSGYHTRDTYKDVTVASARDIAEGALTRMSLMDKLGKGSAQPRREIERTKQHFADAASEVADKVREGSITQRAIRREVDFRAGMKMKERPSPLFAAWANTVTDNIRRTLNTDGDADKLAQIEGVLAQLSLLEDWEALRRLDVELLNLGKRAEGWRNRLIPPQEKVVKFQLLEAKGRDGQ